MKTRTTAEGMARLHANHDTEIQLARQVARELCLKHGSTNSRLVRLEMEKRGLISTTATKVFWFGAVFKKSEFEPTGEWVSYSSISVHERSIRVWRLRSAGKPQSPQPVLHPQQPKAPLVLKSSALVEPEPEKPAPTRQLQFHEVTSW